MDVRGIGTASSSLQSMNRCLPTVMLHDVVHRWPHIRSTCTMSAALGKLDCLTYAHEQGCQWLGLPANTLYIRILTIKSTYTHITYHLIYTSRTEATCAEAAKNDMISCLMYAHENGCPWNEATCRLAAENNKLQCLKYAHENGCTWDRRTCEGAAKHGSIDALIYSHENGCPWNELTCYFAAQSGDVECLKYAHEQGCQWDQIVCAVAAMFGNLSCLKYAYENGCPWCVHDKYFLWLYMCVCVLNYHMMYVGTSS